MTVIESKAIVPDQMKKTALQHNKIVKSWQHDLLVDCIKYSYGATSDGETSTGHQKLRDRTPQEAFEKGCELFDLIMAESERRGFAIEGPSLSDLLDETGIPAGFLQNVGRRSA